MRRRQPSRSSPLPRLWLMTDERQGEGLWAALARLPRGAGVVFRHHATPPAARRALYEKVRAVARRRGLVLVLAGPARLAAAWRADGSHNGGPARPARLRLATASAHDRRQIAAARHADILFLSPLFPTRSHPGAPALGPLRFALLARQSRVPVIALGGVSHAHQRRLARLGAYGWAAIDAWSR